MIGLGIFLLALATVGVVCAVINIAYNPEEYEYEDMRPDGSERRQKHDRAHD